MATSATAPKFEDRDVKLIAASLPAGTDRQRRELLPKILREWSRTDLKEHLSREPHAAIRAQRERLQKVAKRARDLIRALDTLDDHDRSEIAWELARRPRGQTELRRVRARLHEERDFLARFAAAAPKSGFNPGRGQPRNIVASLTMRDIAAIYEWLTGKRAVREVDRNEHNETGPFWQFAAALWPVIFGKGDDGLASAMKNWAHARNKYDEQSALIANIAFRHPTWRVFEG